MEKEIWKDVAEFEGYYKISNFGRLKSFKQYKTGKILSLVNKNKGYFSFVLQANGKKKSTRIHRIVALAFIPNPKNLPQINHKDRNKQNNHVDNLEWCTCCYNVRHSQALNPNQLAGIINYNKHIRPKPIFQYSKNNVLINSYENAKEASKSTGVCQRNILQVANGDHNEAGYLRKSAGGFIWKFESEVNSA